MLPKTPQKWEVVNFATSIAFNYAIFHFMGFKSLLYLLTSTILGTCTCVRAMLTTDCHGIGEG